MRAHPWSSLAAAALIVAIFTACESPQPQSITESRSISEDEPTPPDEGVILAEELLQQVKDGADFAALAAQHSACPSGQQGGSLGFFAAGQMVPEFDAVVQKLQKDEVSDLVETQFGYHIIKGGESKAGEEQAFEQVSASLKQQLKTQKVQMLVQGKVAELQEATDIEILV